MRRVFTTALGVLTAALLALGASGFGTGSADADQARHRTVADNQGPAVISR
ncbi:hypothetical protein ACFWMJ_38260 [Streptomyces hawaiiensis]|uniref:hypothetical protein n=1 Tax=Streptomyces hawaiiensis TaxID=67305 RepID=UPI0036649043